jgi:hypothetical protein
MLDGEISLFRSGDYAALLQLATRPNNTTSPVSVALIIGNDVGTTLMNATFY